MPPEFTEHFHYANKFAVIIFIDYLLVTEDYSIRRTLLVHNANHSNKRHYTRSELISFSTKVVLKRFMRTKLHTYVALVAALSSCFRIVS